MPDRMKQLRASIDRKSCPEFQAFMPALEEILCRGTPEQKKRFAAQLAQEAEGLEVYAYTAAYAGTATQTMDRTQKLWRDIEDSGELSYVLLLWQQSIVYRYWAKWLRDPNEALRLLGA
jgi:hypothetical protein